MARMFRLLAYKNSTPHATIAATVSLRPGAASEARVTVDPSDTVALSLSPDDVWAVRLLHADANDDEGAQKILEGARPGASQYENAFRPPVNNSLGEYIASRTIVLQDRFSAYRDAAPAETITHRNTDTRRELKFIAEQMGMEPPLLAGTSVA